MVRNRTAPDGVEGEFLQTRSESSKLNESARRARETKRVRVLNEKRGNKFDILVERTVFRVVSIQKFMKYVVKKYIF